MPVCIAVFIRHTRTYCGTHTTCTSIVVVAGNRVPYPPMFPQQPFLSFSANEHIALLQAGRCVPPRGPYHVDRPGGGGGLRENTRARPFGAGTLGIGRCQHASQRAHRLVTADCHQEGGKYEILGRWTD